MNRTLLLATLSLFLTFCPAAPTRGASITYNIQNYPAYQNGYTLSGTITTDGTIGPLLSSDITSWSYTVTGTNGYTLTSASPTAEVTIYGVLTASPTSITQSDPGPSTTNLLEFSITAIGAAVQLGWDQGHGIEAYQGASLDGTTTLWVSSTLPDNALGGAPWVIATSTVPEPGSLTLALLGSACLAVVLWTRRRRRVASSSQASPTAYS